MSRILYDEDMTIEEMWEFLVDADIATTAELQLVTDINGYSKDTMWDVLYARTAYRSFEQLSRD